MIYFANIIFQIFLVVTAEDGSGQGIEPQSGLPVCTAIQQGEDLSWPALLRDFYELTTNLTEVWNKGDEKVTDNVANFVKYQLAGMYGKLHSCMPEYLESIHTRFQCDIGCDYPVEDNIEGDSIMQSPKPDNMEKARERDWMQTIKKMPKNRMLPDRS